MRTLNSHSLSLPFNLLNLEAKKVIFFSEDESPFKYVCLRLKKGEF